MAYFFVGARHLLVAALPVVATNALTTDVNLLPISTGGTTADGVAAQPTPGTVQPVNEVGYQAVAKTGSNQEMAILIRDVAADGVAGRPTSGMVQPLNEDGYQAVAEMGSNQEMAIFIRRLLSSMHRDITHEGYINGFVPFYSGVNGTQNFARLKAELLDAPWVQAQSSNSTETGTDLYGVAADRSQEQQLKSAAAMQEILSATSLAKEKLRLKEDKLLAKLLASQNQTVQVQEEVVASRSRLQNVSNRVHDLAGGVVRLKEQVTHLAKLVGATPPSVILPTEDAFQIANVSKALEVKWSFQGESHQLAQKQDKKGSGIQKNITTQHQLEEIERVQAEAMNAIKERFSTLKSLARKERHEVEHEKERISAAIIALQALESKLVVAKTILFAAKNDFKQKASKMKKANGLQK